MARLPASFITAILLLPLVRLTNGQLFTVNCAPLTIQRSDPIVNPGAASGHVHAIIGGTAFQRTMSQTTAGNARTTTCDKKLDKSNYWVPQLYHIRGDGRFEIVQFQGSAVYYLNRACNYAAGKTQCEAGFNSRAPPAGLRMLAGNPSLRTYNPNSFAQNAILYTCLKNGPGTPETNGFPNEACLRLRAEVFFPSCWNGRDLDSADHKSHLAYPAIGSYNGGVCPASHPIAILSVFFEFYFFTEPFPDHKFVWAMGDTTGYGFHGDFINGWDQNALDRSLATCQGPQGAYDPNCSINAGQGSASQETLEVPAPVEDVGLNAPLNALPGNNPITKRSRIFGTSF